MGERKRRREPRKGKGATYNARAGVDQALDFLAAWPAWLEAEASRGCNGQGCSLLQCLACWGCRIAGCSVALRGTPWAAGPWAGLDCGTAALQHCCSAGGGEARRRNPSYARYLTPGPLGRCAAGRRAARRRPGWRSALPRGPLGWDCRKTFPTFGFWSRSQSTQGESKCRAVLWPVCSAPPSRCGEPEGGGGGGLQCHCLEASRQNQQCPVQTSYGSNAFRLFTNAFAEALGPVAHLPYVTTHPLPYFPCPPRR